MVCKMLFIQNSPIFHIPEKLWRIRRIKRLKLQSVMLFKQTRQRVQGVQVFHFCAVNVNDEHTKPRLKRKLRG